ncbi:MAG: hypothetical protein E7Z87_05230 [Cyanobacteria bacterium SIG26]|nr:hypothetical protein [Cyanobacteria bacterium SIG26]
MRINNINLNHNMISFSSYNKLDKETGLSTSTAFYLDHPVLEKSAQIINRTFPEGTNIMVYAGSNGEEALSLNTFLKNKNNYQIYSIDPCSEAINYAQRGVYAVHPQMSDGFLINDVKNKKQEQLTKKFYKHFTEIPKPNEEIDNVTDSVYCLAFDDVELFPQKYFIPKYTINNNIHFVKDDINNIKNIELNSHNGKVGAIFFRNAFYHVIKNDLTGIIGYGEKPDLNLNKQEVLNDLINNKIYNKLEVGGILVLGNHLQEHLFIADKSIPEEETILFDPVRNLRYSSKHLLFEALNKQGKFKPIYNNIVSGLNKENNCKLPLIWQKIR